MSMQLRTARRMVDMRQKNPAQPAESWLFCLDHAFVYEMQVKGGLDLADLANLTKPVLDPDGKPVLEPVLDEAGLPKFDAAGKPLEQPQTRIDMAMAYKILFHLSATWRRRNGLKMDMDAFFDELPEDFSMPMRVISELFAEAWGGTELADNVKPAQKAVAAGEPGNETPQEDVA